MLPCEYAGSDLQNITKYATIFIILYIGHLFVLSSSERSLERMNAFLLPLSSEMRTGSGSLNLAPSSLFNVFQQLPSQLLSFLLLGPFFCQHWSMLQESGPFYLLFYFSLVIVGENLMVWFQSIDITDGILFLGYMRLFL